MLSKFIVIMALMALFVPGMAVLADGGVEDAILIELVQDYLATTDDDPMHIRDMELGAILRTRGWDVTDAEVTASFGEMILMPRARVESLFGSPDEPLPEDEAEEALGRSDEDISSDLALRAEASTDGTVTLTAEELDFLLRKTSDRRLSLEELETILNEDGTITMTLDELAELLGEDSMSARELADLLFELGTADDVTEADPGASVDTGEVRDDNRIQPLPGSWVATLRTDEAVVGSGCPAGVVRDALATGASGLNGSTIDIYYSGAFSAGVLITTAGYNYGNPEPDSYTAIQIVPGFGTMAYVYKVRSESYIRVGLIANITALNCNFFVPGRLEREG
ncbi:hypothetical protein MASR2M15_18730 [Anaerolineales bacterium]